MSCSEVLLRGKLGCPGPEEGFLCRLAPSAACRQSGGRAGALLEEEPGGGSSLVLGRLASTGCEQKEGL